MKLSLSFAVLAFQLLFYNSVNAQDVLWEKTMGGQHSEYLYDVKPTPDYGFILAGSSLSEDSGNKSEAGQGDLDYFLWKMDEEGHMEWQKSLGGNGADYLYCVNMTREGGYILGGSSYSSASGNKKEATRGLDDFWIVKLDPAGNLEWEKTLGGFGSDKLLSIRQTKDGGYIMGGTSNSDKSGEKAEMAQGNTDFWVIKVDAEGNEQWQRTLGGQYAEELRRIMETEEGFLLGGYTNSPASGNKLSDAHGLGDFWLIQLNPEGETLWEKTIGGKGDDQLHDLLATNDGFLLAGSSNSEVSELKRASNGEGTDFWLVKIDHDGELLWDKTYDFGRWDLLKSIVKSKDGDGYLLAGYAHTEVLSSGNSPIEGVDKQGINDYIALKINNRGEMQWQKTLGGKGSDRMQGIIQSRDGGYILAGTSDSPEGNDKKEGGHGQNDYWVVKLLDQRAKTKEERQVIEVYPNPTKAYSNVLIHADFDTATIEVYDMVGSKILSQEARYGSTPLYLGNASSGVYVVKVVVNGESYSTKVIKE